MVDWTHSSARPNPLADWALKVARFAEDVRRRRRFKRLLDMSDHMLDDIGVTREEVEQAAGLPLSSNAAVELSITALERRRRG